MRYKRYQAAWNAIKRCTDETYSRYCDYGGRGIRVKFRDVYEFLEYLLTLPGWNDPKKVLDRKDNNGHYEPGNLQFVTRRESMLNRRRPRPYVSVGTDISDRRASAGVSQSQVHRDTGINRVSIRRFERGEIVTPRTRKVLSDYYAKFTKV